MWGAEHSGDPTKKEEYSQVKGDSAGGPGTSRVTDRREGCVGQQWGRDRTQGVSTEGTQVWGQVRAVLGDLCVWRAATRLEEEQ